MQPVQRDRSSSLALPAAPSWFGPNDGRCFGWYHAPAGPTRGSTIILCPPFGQEFLCTYRAYRHLAERLAAMGFPTLRFDYPGTGDAPGSDTDPDRVGSWLRGVHAAIDHARRLSGVSRVSLVGMRIGATLATFAAAERGGVDGLVLIAPCASGGTYLREVRAMRELRKQGVLRPFPDQCPGDEELLGFVFRSDTIEDMKRLDLRKLSARPCNRVLLVPRDDLPGQDKPILKRFSEVGTDVVVRNLPGYAESMSEDPYFVIVPDRLWDGVVDWLGEAWAATDPSMEAPPASVLEAVALDSSGLSIHESIVRFGEGGRLFGILAEPESQSHKVALVIANTGANHRAGANRLGVELARRLARRGVAALRIDLGGLGDSAPLQGKSENELYADHSTNDLRAATDLLRSRAYQKIVLIGICSGGYVSFQASLVDTRVRGLVMINPLAFEWQDGAQVERGGYASTHYYTQTVFRWSTWKRLVRGELNVRGVGAFLSRQALARAKTMAKVVAAFGGIGQFASPLAKKFASLVRRGTQVLVVFNRDEPMVDKLATDLGPAAARVLGKNFRIEMVDGADHVFVPVWSQRRLTDIICEFVEKDVALDSEPS